ncbi:hypothetical protein pb186bvf_003128 [Paramecium bursaria]
MAYDQQWLNTANIMIILKFENEYIFLRVIILFNTLVILIQMIQEREKHQSEGKPER